MKNKSELVPLSPATGLEQITACDRITRISFCALVAFVTVLSGCANSPLALSKMTLEELQTVDEHSLCGAYVSSVRTTNISNEVKRRGITCKREVALYVSDCSDLRITSVARNPKYINVTDFVVTNNSNEIKKFNVTLPDNMLSSDFKIGPHSSGPYHVAIDPKDQRSAKVVGLISGRSATVPFKLNTCYASDRMD